VTKPSTKFSRDIQKGVVPKVGTELKMVNEHPYAGPRNGTIVKFYGTNSGSYIRITRGRSPEDWLTPEDWFAYRFEYVKETKDMLIRRLLDE
jgi:hypothetical protein